MLADNNTLYQLLHETIQNLYFEIHAIYEPDPGEPFPDCFCAAVDLFSPGLTFRVYFKLSEDGSIHVKHVQRWFFG